MQTAAAPRTIHLEIGKRELDSGLKLLAVQNAGVSTFACALHLEVDVRNEARGEEGLANLVGECLDEGTRKRSAFALAEAVESLGGSMEGNSSGGTVLVPADSAAKAVALLVEMATAPAFPAREVGRVKAEVVSEILADQEDPQVVGGQRFRREVYGAHPYARSKRGQSARVRAFATADLRRFHGKWFVPAGGYFVAAGPFEVERTLDLLQRCMRGFRGKAPARAVCATPSLPRERRDVHVPMPREQVHVFVGHVGIRRTDPDYLALSVMDHVLGSGPGFTSRISRKLRDEMGLCYSVHAGITSSAGEEPGAFTAYIGTSAESRARAVEVFLEEMERMRSEPPTAAEVTDVQDYLTGSFALSLERNTSLIRYAVAADRFNLGFDWVHRYPGLVRAIGPADVQRAAVAHLHPERVVVVSAGAG
jgi:zinc protease